MKYIFIGLFCSFLVSCDPTPQADSDASATNSNTVGNTRPQNVDPKDLPPGLSGSPLAPVPNSAPGLNSANGVNGVPKGATPTPGIPDPIALGKPPIPGATPTPGIPDPATMKKQMEEIRTRLNSNANQPPPALPSNSVARPIRKRKIANMNE